MRKDAITLMELLIVIIIIGILAAIAVPIYTGKVERTRGERAIANIELIKDAYKQYYIKYKSYITMPVDGPGLDYINARLGLDLTDPDFNYTIAPNFITAERNGLTIIYNIDPADNDPDDWDSGTWPWHPT